MPDADSVPDRPVVVPQVHLIDPGAPEKALRSDGIVVNVRADIPNRGDMVAREAMAMTSRPAAMADFNRRKGARSPPAAMTVQVPTSISMVMVLVVPVVDFAAATAVRVRARRAQREQGGH